MPKAKLKPQTPATPPECAMISEKQFMRDHTMYSAASSWLFAIAGATNIGLLSVIAAKVLTAVEQGRPIFRSNDPKVEPVMSNKKYNRVALIMMAFGGACMTLSNWLESKKVVTEWQLGAGKLQRKTNIAEKEAEHADAVNQSIADSPCRKKAYAELVGNSGESRQSQSWVETTQRKATDLDNQLSSSYPG